MPPDVAELVVPDRTRRPDFKVHTGDLVVTKAADDGAPAPDGLLAAVGSSTVRDLQGDTMELTALKDMQAVPLGMAIFVNHAYSVPEDIVGMLAAKPGIAINDDIADLTLRIQLLLFKERVKELWQG